MTLMLHKQNKFLKKKTHIFKIDGKGHAPQFYDNCKMFMFEMDDGDVVVLCEKL